MKKINHFAIILTLFGAIACTESDKKAAEDAITNAQPQTTFTAATDGTPGSQVTVQAAHGTCTVSVDDMHVTYEKTDISYQGQDSCSTDENIDIGCGAAPTYRINFSAPTPALTRQVDPC